MEWLAWRPKNVRHNDSPGPLSGSLSSFVPLSGLWLGQVLRGVAVGAALASSSSFLPAADAGHPPPGSYRTSWVGNTFPGDGGPNGFGYWVQNGADEIEVTPDGTVIAGTDWDEAGRCVGLYKDGKANRVLVKKEGGRETAWGWNTGNHAIAVDGTNIFVANTGKRLLQFSWTPGDLDSVKFKREAEMEEKAIGLAARGRKLVVVSTNRVVEWEVGDLELRGHFTFAVQGAKDVVITTNYLNLVLVGNEIVPVTDNIPPGWSITNLTKPTAISLAPDGRLIVCDDGADQQIKFFDISSGQPKLVGTFGDKSGLRSGRPGISAPTKLYAPRGAGMDTNGNLYVALGFNGAPVGTLVLRSFTPDGKLRWELANHAFVDTFGFDPDADGRVIYSRTAVFDLDLESATANPPWKQRATTVDHVGFPDDPRANSAMTVYLRHLQGRRLLYGIGQYGGGYRLFAFDEPDGWLAHPVGRLTAKGETWAWHVADNGDIWHGDAPGKTIRRHAFRGCSADGKPEFETEKPESWPWPEDFGNVRRIIYVQTTDTLYLSGYLKGESVDSWGVCGKTFRRYDGWLRGSKETRWTIKLPLNPDGEGKGKALSPQALALAGDYIFVGMVKPDGGKQHLHILATKDGSYVGSFVPGPEVGGNAGWEDMPFAVAALKRKNGEYLVLVEEDWRGKNLLYRWKPQ
jgi:hypothetical protein